MLQFTSEEIKAVNEMERMELDKVRFTSIFEAYCLKRHKLLCYPSE